MRIDSQNPIGERERERENAFYNAELDTFTSFPPKSILIFNIHHDFKQMFDTFF